MLGILLGFASAVAEATAQEDTAYFVLRASNRRRYRSSRAVPANHHRGDRSAGAEWGTDFDQTQDVASIAMVNGPADQHVEQFTMTVGSESGAGRLALLWGNVHVWVPVRAAP